MENWRNFEENEKRRLDEAFRGPTDDPSFSDPGYNEPEGYDVFADKISDIVDDVTRGQQFKMPNGQVLSYEDFGDGDGQYILDGDVFANSFDEAEEKLLDMMDMDSVMSSLNESEITRLISEEIDRLIEEGLLEEGFKDKMLKVLAGLTFAGAALGGMPGEARADLSPEQATQAIVKVMNQTAKKTDMKDHLGLDLQFQEADPQMGRLGDALSDLTKASDAKDSVIVKTVAKSVLNNLQPDEDGEASNHPTFAVDAAIDAANDYTKKLNKNKKKQQMKKKKATKANMVNFEGAVANAYNAMQLASAQDDDAAIKKAVNNLFDILDAAEKQGALDGKAAKAKELLGKGDTAGFKKLMGY